jgi:hypothetical protein
MKIDFYIVNIYSYLITFQFYHHLIILIQEFFYKCFKIMKHALLVKENLIRSSNIWNILLKMYVQFIFK